MKTILSLTPTAVWKNFHAMTQIPRPSGHCEEITKFLLDFGKNLGLESFTDEIGNVIIRKPATPGMEDRRGVIFQGHMDMVPQKNNDKTHDFKKDPIETVIDGEWVKANGTTLGADNGLGVAAAMAILEDKEIKHGPLELLVTIDEEVGMIGANALKEGTLQGDILLNLDSESEGDLYIGCAGGVDLVASMQYKEVAPEADDVAVEINLKGLRGGHSGLEIIDGRANANKLMVRFVREAIASNEARLSSWNGGNMRNAIPREAVVVLTLPKENLDELKGLASYCENLFNEEFGAIETPIVLDVKEVDLPKGNMPEEIQDNAVSAIFACHDGVLRMIPTIPDTVETSSNLSIVTINEGNISIEFLIRSSSDSMKEYLSTTLESCFAMAGMKTELMGSYSGWDPNVDSPIMKTMKSAYEKLFNVEPDVKVIHAGLECGIIGAIETGLDMISFGPDIENPHSPDERTHIGSVQKFYDLMVEAIQTIPVK